MGACFIEDFCKYCIENKALSIQLTGGIRLIGSAPAVANKFPNKDNALLAIWQAIAGQIEPLAANRYIISSDIKVADIACGGTICDAPNIRELTRAASHTGRFCLIH